MRCTILDTPMKTFSKCWFFVYASSWNKLEKPHNRLYKCLGKWFSRSVFTRRRITRPENCPQPIDRLCPVYNVDKHTCVDGMSVVCPLLDIPFPFISLKHWISQNHRFIFFWPKGYGQSGQYLDHPMNRITKLSTTFEDRLWTGCGQSGQVVTIKTMCVAHHSESHHWSVMNIQTYHQSIFQTPLKCVWNHSVQ